MTERRSKGFFFYFCDEPSLIHALTHKKLGIHVLEMNDMKVEMVDQSEDTQEEGNNSLDPQISINALSCIVSFKTM